MGRELRSAAESSAQDPPIGVCVPCLPSEPPVEAQAGRKLYAKRDTKGRIKDIQAFKRAHGQDVKRRAKAERAGK